MIERPNTLSVTITKTKHIKGLKLLEELLLITKISMIMNTINISRFMRIMIFFLLSAKKEVAKNLISMKMRILENIQSFKL